jgi:hypothetical protein
MSNTQPVTIQPRPAVKQINYVSKTFTDFKQNLIDFARAYYPNTYSDFNETSPGMMFIEMAAYIGDVMSFYIDNQFKESLLAYAEQQENVISIAQFLGYKPKLTSPATVTARLYQTAPAIEQNGIYIPNPKYLLKVGRGSTFKTTGQTSIDFRLVEDVDFADITGENYTILTYNNGTPDTFVVTKSVKLVAATEKTTVFSFGSPQTFSSVLMPEDNIIGIESVIDGDGNRWYEVDYLAQDVVMEDMNVNSNDEPGQMPSAGLRLRKVPRRFVTRLTRTGRMELLFGSGVDNLAETLVDSRQVANAQYGNTISSILGNVAVNNVNFLTTNSYGLSPANTILSVSYIVGGGVETNTSSNTINVVSQLNILNDTTGYTSGELTQFSSRVQSVVVNNEIPATGGGDGESLEEIRQNALAFFNAQNRVVTVEDYAVRTYTLPSRYGKIAKAYAIRDEQINRILAPQTDRVYVNNPVRPNAINLYTLGYDTNGNLEKLNTLVKENLARYLEQFRLLTDDVNILDAFIINIGVEFDISVLRNYNVNDVLARSIGTVQEFFDISNWNINQPIIISDLMYKIGLVEGVQTVRDVRITNKYGEGYQPYRYDISEATINGVVYPSLDPSIFEIKYPQSDITGKVTQ